jgi:phosphoglycerate dehydrogenase-like enzyme
MQLVLPTDANGSHFGMLDDLKAVGIDVTRAFDESAQRRDRPDFQRSDAVVSNARGAHAPNLAEHVFAMILAFSRGILHAHEFQTCSFWNSCGARESSYELAGKTLGLIGSGNIGRQVARRPRAFDLRVLVVDAEPVASDDPSTKVWPLGRLDDLLAQSDIVMIAAPATPESKHLIGAAQL